METDASILSILISFIVGVIGGCVLTYYILKRKLLNKVTKR